MGSNQHAPKDITVFKTDEHASLASLHTISTSAHNGVTFVDELTEHQSRVQKSCYILPMTPTLHPSTGMTWHLYEMMANRKIRTAAELKRRLDSVGVEFSLGHISNLVNRPPRRISMELLYGITTVLDCSVDDLIKRPTKH